MEHELLFGPAADELRIRVTGLATVDGFLRMIDEGIGDPRWRPPMRALLDYTDLDMSALSAEQMRQVAAHATAFDAQLAGARVAVLAPRALAYGLARLSAAAAQLTTAEVQVFGERDAAESWLAS